MPLGMESDVNLGFELVCEPGRTLCFGTTPCDLPPQSGRAREGMSSFLFCVPPGGHDVHGTENQALLVKPANVMCLECHGPGGECIECHMAKIEQTLADQYKIPNPCTTCHKDWTTTWATNQLKSWKTVS